MEKQTPTFSKCLLKRDRAGYAVYTEFMSTHRGRRDNLETLEAWNCSKLAYKFYEPL